MSSTSFLDNPLLKVSRPVAACSRCRTAKIKCDGKLPACSACERVGKASTCSGASDEFAKGKERSYVASLEGYCERLEKKIASLRQRQQVLSGDGAGVARESSITSVSATGTLDKEHRKEVSDIDDLVGDFGFLSVNATSRDFHGITSSTSFANLLLSVSVVDSLPQLPRQPLPPRHEATPLLQYYFDNIFTQLPFFAETSFWTSVDAVYQSDGRFAKPFDHWILRMALAVVSASFSHQSNDENHQKALSLVSGAMQYCEDVLHPGSIPGIQAILFLVQYSLVDPVHFRTWYLVGMAARVMVDLGLHQDPPSEVLSSTDRLDLRRKVFHCIYTLDRAVSTALGRTFSFSDESVSVALPSSTLGSSFTDHNHLFLRSSEPALYMIKIRRILSQGYRDMYFDGREPSSQALTDSWALCSQAQEWFDNAPKNVPPHFTTLYKLELLYTTSILLSPSHRYPTICDFNKALLFERCMDYIDQLHQVLENPTLLSSITFLEFQRAYQVGRRFVDVLTSDYDFVLGPSAPAPPPMSHGAPDPPLLGGDDQINSHARAIRCITYIQDLLRYCATKWDFHTLLDQFEQASASIQKRLNQASMMYIPGTSTYMTGLSPNVLPTGGSGYSGFDSGNYGL